MGQVETAYGLAPRLISRSRENAGLYNRPDYTCAWVGPYMRPLFPLGSWRYTETLGRALLI